MTSKNDHITRTEGSPRGKPHISLDTIGTSKGRPVRIVDGSGMYECKYDKLGNVTDELRTISMPHHGEVYKFRMSYQYDSWGRMLSMTYPDGEWVSYRYNAAGDLYGMDWAKDSQSGCFIDRIRYNKYGNRTYMEYGNHTATHYTSPGRDVYPMNTFINGEQQ